MKYDLAILMKKRLEANKSIFKFAEDDEPEEIMLDKDSIDSVMRLLSHEDPSFIRMGLELLAASSKNYENFLNLKEAFTEKIIPKLAKELVLMAITQYNGTESFADRSDTVQIIFETYSNSAGVLETTFPMKEDPFWLIQIKNDVSELISGIAHYIGKKPSYENYFDKIPKDAINYITTTISSIEYWCSEVTHETSIHRICEKEDNKDGTEAVWEPTGEYEVFSDDPNERESALSIEWKDYSEYREISDDLPDIDWGYDNPIALVTGASNIMTLHDNDDYFEENYRASGKCEDPYDEDGDEKEVVYTSDPVGWNYLYSLTINKTYVNSEGKEVDIDFNDFEIELIEDKYEK